MMRKYVFIALALFVFIVNGEVQHNEAVVASSGPIPEDAIRLRILANSDAPRDQWLKRKIRDDVVDYMEQLTGEMDSLETARKLIVSRLPDIKRRAEAIARAYGFTYSVDVDYGYIPFPTKMYGNRVYPAGEYEAVRISLGSGTGANWWCVLFPPLCFVDMTNADAVTDDSAGEGRQSEPESEKRSPVEEAEGGDEVEVRFFLLDWFHDFMDKIKRAF
jgi:stage II sporulation protein R